MSGLNVGCVDWLAGSFLAESMNRGLLRNGVLLVGVEIPGGIGRGGGIGVV